VVFIGDCAQWKGQIDGKLVEVGNLYRHRSTLDPHTIQGEDLVAKMVRTRLLMKRAEGQPYLRLTGCPVSVAEQLQVLVALGGLHDPSRSWSGMKSYMTWKSTMLMKRMTGQKYQIHGPTQRGAAAADLTNDK
jgi:hypothetical protein